MATNLVLEKFAASTAMTITLNALASSTAGVGRQSTLLDNSTVKHRRAIVYFMVTLGTSPTANKSVQFYLLRGDANATPSRTDAAGASDAALKLKNATCCFVEQNPTAVPGEVVQGEFVVENLGPEWGIAVVHDTAVNLKASTDHWVRYVYVDDDIQAAA